ncbi:kinase-like domain-containing protein [Mycena epipterygia]|nr:kinase-like domain-containing protein [Mycena epipterygia]
MSIAEREHSRPTSPTCTLLGEQERQWMHYQPFLEKQGYMLRRRYRPGWISEVLTLGKSPWHCEDSISTRGRVLDATRISDGAQVILKMVEMISTETTVSKFLANEPGADNHTITMLELIPMHDDPEHAFLVMPRMRGCSDPPLFATVGEFIEFVEQVLQGLAFLHSKNIAHRDICTLNLVMDSSRLIPGGFHFLSACTSDGVNYLYPGANDSHPGVMKTRSMAAPMQYYYIDFGLSVHFPTFEARQLVTGECGQLRKHVPEISDTIPYDAFKADVRLVGEMLRTDFLLFYTGLDFIIPFVKKLRRRNPARRPDAVQALALFQCLVSRMKERELMTPLDICSTGRSRRAMLLLKGLGFH